MLRNTFKYQLILFFLLAPCLSGLGQIFKPVSELVDQLNQSEAEGVDQLDKVWQQLVANNQVPYVYKDSVLFMYKGKVQKVAWNGDINAWGGDTTVNNIGTRIGKSDLWVLKYSFPENARIDYKIVLNNKKHIADPVNPYHQWTGANGGSNNSELRMPLWKPEPLTQPIPSIKVGKVSTTITIASKALSYKVNYTVYTPFNYSKKRNKLPVIYITDGHEYADDRMGAVVTVLNNLIDAGKIQPLIAVFIDPRNPENHSENRRDKEFLFNDQYVQFVTNELVPEIDKRYTTIQSASGRTILGTSYGGSCAAYFGYKASDTFQNIAIQSPSFWYKAPKMLELYESSPKLPIKVFMSTGVIYDTQYHARLMKSIMEKKGYPLRYIEVNQGHSWGNWRTLIDDILVYFFPQLSLIHPMDRRALIALFHEQECCLNQLKH